jgi:hypothetical protein
MHIFEKCLEAKFCPEILQKNSPGRGPFAQPLPDLVDVFQPRLPVARHFRLPHFRSQVSLDERLAFGLLDPGFGSRNGIRFRRVWGQCYEFLNFRRKTCRKMAFLAQISDMYVCMYVCMQIEMVITLVF